MQTRMWKKPSKRSSSYLLLSLLHTVTEHSCFFAGWLGLYQHILSSHWMIGTWGACYVYPTLKGKSLSRSGQSRMRQKRMHWKNIKTIWNDMKWYEMLGSFWCHAWCPVRPLHPSPLSFPAAQGNLLSAHFRGWFIEGLLRVHKPVQSWRCWHRFL